MCNRITKLLSNCYMLQRFLTIRHCKMVTSEQITLLQYITVQHVSLHQSKQLKKTHDKNTLLHIDIHVCATYYASHTINIMTLVWLTSVHSALAVILCVFSSSNGIDGLHSYSIFSTWFELLQRDWCIVGVLWFHNVGCRVVVWDVISIVRQASFMSGWLPRHLQCVTGLCLDSDTSGGTWACTHTRV